METWFRKDISLIDSAESVGISPYYLSHIFKERTGQTFVEYLSQVRIEEAKRLCSDTTLSLKEISEQCGYLNITYFCKVFKRLTGKTIGEYRKMLKP
ncbi:MAG: helix-turn-helix domain-containing protein [Lachnospiraceae bacterium]|nr:helix-turn-helix domain-containing protein [Lachnospiraceae bacterium]